MKRLSILISAATLCVSANMAFAQAQDHSQHTGIPAHTEPAAQMSSGEIVKIDKETAKLTIKHGPLVNLKMPGMTMAFKVKNPKMLDQVAAGDKVSFVAENVQGALTVTTLEVVK
jgi:Cu(I)/Ag(I) efflux system protein CusF